MNKDKEINRRKVTSVGNSWIICKSKSHPGHVYYFNSLTGQAAWNLSDVEIEKARQTTKHLENTTGAELACPEPKEKPPSLSPIAEPTQPAVMKRIPPFENPQMNINTEQQSSLLANLNVPLNQLTSILQSTQMNASSLGPICNMNLLNNPTHAFNLSNTTPMYNPKVWAVPQAQQIFLPTPMVNLVNPGPSSLNGVYNNLVESSTGSIYDNINNASSSSIPVGSQAFNTRNFKYRKGFQQPINKQHGFSNKKDLRQIISFKNKFQRKPGGPNIHINSNKPGNHSSDFSNRMGNKDNKCTDAQMLEDSSKIDVSPLRDLAPSDCYSNAWFIVMDLEVLLNEFKFLNILTDSDEKCHLMVPKRVMEELKTYVTCTENVQARRILRFLSQQIEIGYAFMAEYPCGVENMSMTEVIEATCAELMNKKYHFVLLTNDNELITRDSLVNINMFTISEIRNLLGIQPKKQQIVTPNVVPKQTLSVNELLNKIKITVPNNFTPNRDTASPDRDIQDDDIIEEVDIKPKPEESVSLKHTVDTGIQTDFEDIASNSSVSKDNEEINRVPNTIEIRKEADIRPPVTSFVVNVTDKKRGIKLKRSVSSQPPVNSDEKRQFKWRRRRNTTPQPNKEIPHCSDENTNSKELETICLSNDKPKEQEEPPNDDPVSESKDNRLNNDSIESEESSIIANPRNSVSQENVTVDETSTSGIISNTESSVDECNYTTSSNLSRKANEKSMYRVDSTTMEQYLKVKCDEWISRFVQIMEEVLSQVLHQDPPFSNSKLPPPWTLHEASLCIAMKFSDFKDIKEAANKLSSYVFRVSDEKGTIMLNMTAYQYMQMYSYGMHLLGALMEATPNVEDIKIAVESLNTLLHDIKNPCVDHSANDSFYDNDHEISSNAIHPNLLGNNDVSSEHDHEMSIDDNANIAEVNKKSPVKRKLIEEEPPQPVKFIRNVNISSPLFKQMTFQKSNAPNNSLIDKSNLQSDEKSNSCKEGERNAVDTATETTAKENNAPTTQPSIIRKFTACPEIEKKLQISNLYENHDEELDYDEDEEYLTEEYCSEDENNSALHDDPISDKIDETDSLQTNEREALEVINPSMINENNKKFKYAMCMFFQEIKDALSQVQILCDRCYKALENPDSSAELRLQLRTKAESACAHIIHLSKSLESMLDHEANNPSRSMSQLLMQADVNMSELDAGLLSKYRISIAKCKECADSFLKSAQDIISRLTCI